MLSRPAQLANLAAGAAVVAVTAFPAAARGQPSTEAARAAAASGMRAAPVWVVRTTAQDRPAAGPAGPAARWIRVTLREIRSHRTSPPRAARALALVSVAMNDALVRAGRLRRDPPPARAVAAGAAATVLAHLYPEDATALRFAGRRAARIRTARPERAGRRAVTGWQTGRSVGAKVVRRARSDGSAAVGSVEPPTGRDAWEPTPPGFAPPLEPLAGTWRPWNLRHPSVLRPPPPPRHGSRAFIEQAQEVYDVSQSLTAEQAEVARSWADGPGTATPPGHWNLVALELLGRHPVGAGREARLLAVLNTAQADAFIACWDAKYAYWSQRPVSVLRRGWDPDWTPLLETPPFPSYVSGHAATSGAAAGVLGRFFPGARRRLAASAQEAGLSRLYAGIHFRSDNEAGLQLGRRIARAALRRAG